MLLFPPNEIHEYTALVCGSRTFNDRRRVFERLDQFVIGRILEGGAHGADAFAAEYACVNGIPFEVFFPDVANYGSPAAFHIRNRAMLDRCGFVIAFYDTLTPGTASVIREAQRRSLPVHKG
jgi:uncharacterized phage-like protein YoqJ